MNEKKISAWIRCWSIAATIAFLTSGCATTITHSSSGSRFPSPPNPVSIGVYEIQNATDGNYLHLWTGPPYGFTEEPHQALTRILVSELQASDIFERVMSISSPSSSFMSYDPSRQSDMEIALLGTLFAYKAGGAPHAYGFVLPTSLLAIVGIPTMPGYQRSHIDYEIRVVDVKSRQVLWSTGRRTARHDVDPTFSSWTTDPGFWRNLNNNLASTWITDIVNELSDASRRGEIMAALQQVKRTTEPPARYTDDFRNADTFSLPSRTFPRRNISGREDQLLETVDALAIELAWRYAQNRNQ